MFEAYSVAITLKLNNLVSAQLALLSKEFLKLDELAIGLSKSLGKIEVDSAALRGLTRSVDSTNRAFERANLNASAFHNHLAGIQGKSAALGARGGGGAGAIGMGAAGFAAGDMFLPMAAAGAIGYAGKSLFDSAKALDTERQRFKLFGLSDAQNSEAFNFAANMRVYGSTQIENLRNFREAQGIFREAGLGGSEALAGARIAAPILSRLNALDAGLDGESAARSASSNMAMLRFVESAGGLKSQAEFKRLADIGYRLKVGSGDTVDWQQLQQFERRGGSSAINLTGEGLARLEPSIATLGGASAGTALATQFGRLQGIIRGLPVPVIDEMLKYGIWDKSKVELNSKGGIAKFLDPHGPLANQNAKMLAEDPEGFYEKVIRPIYEKMGLDAAGITRQNALLYGRTGGALANEWEKQLQTIQRAAAAFNKTLGIDAAGGKLKDSLTGQELEFQAAWTDFKTQFGTKMLPFFSGILKVGSETLHNLPSASIWTSAVPVGAAFNGLEDLFTKTGSGTGSPSDSRNSRFVGKGGGMFQFNLNADAQRMGITVAPVVTGEQSRAAAAPQTGIGTFDSTQALIPAGGLY